MAKRALCVGIYVYPFQDSNLNGCVNDARAWVDMLTGHFDFPTSDVRIVTDAEATKAGILSGLKTLLAGAKSGDVLVFTNSSHGSYLLDKSGDEEKFDQVVCPHDVDANVILDDELRELFSALPNGVQMVAIMDNCHSGSGTRIDGSEFLKKRFLDPRLRGDLALPDNLLDPPQSARGGFSEEDMNEVLLSGCTATESSYDDQIDGTFHGAMTYYPLKAIRDANYGKNPRGLTYAQLHTRLTFLVDEAGYAQHPQLEGRHENTRRPVFA